MNDHPHRTPERRAQARNNEASAPSLPQVPSSPSTSAHTDGKWAPPSAQPTSRPAVPMAPVKYEPPISAIGPLFQHRLEQIHRCRVAFSLEIHERPTQRVLGGYYRSRRLVRVYSHDSTDGRRPTDELFDTFLHEIAHHLEYTEPATFGSRTCRRVPGLMHSRLFWRILGELKWRWAELRLPAPSSLAALARSWESESPHEPTASASADAGILGVSESRKTAWSRTLQACVKCKVVPVGMLSPTLPRRTAKADSRAPVPQSVQKRCSQETLEKQGRSRAPGLMGNA